MPKLYILGAGCSRNYSQRILNIDGLLSPLDADFFKMAKKMILARGYDYMFYVQLDHFLNDLAEMYGYNRLPGEPIDILDDPRLGLEGVMTTFELRGDVFRKPDMLFGFRAPYLSGVEPNRVFFLKRIIAETITKALAGPTCKKHIKLAESMRAGDVVLSFNYDALMENALRATKKFTDRGYLVTFYEVFDGREWIKPQYEKPPIRVIKLHGSLNWWRCSFCGSNILYDRKFDDGDMPWAYDLQMGPCPKCKEGMLNLERLLVSPLLTKSYNDPAINYLWLEAERVLHEVQEVVVIGYSLPRTDLASETLLRTGFGNRAREIPVTIVDPDKEVETRFSRIFDPDKITHIEKPDEYFGSI